MNKRYFKILFVMVVLGMCSACNLLPPAVAEILPAAVSAATQSAPPTAALPTAMPTLKSQPAQAVLPTAAPPTDMPTLKSQPAQVASGGNLQPTLVPALDANGDGKIDVCEAIPQVVLEKTLGRKQVGPGQPFQDPSLGDGCAYDFGKDSSAAYFVYVTIASDKQFTAALANAVKAEPVTTLGDSAFLNYGADARQLWVRVGKKAALVAIGDRENVAAALIFAPYLIDFASVPGQVTAASFTGSWLYVEPIPADPNKGTQYCRVDISAQGSLLTVKFASVCSPLTFSDFMTRTVPFQGSPVVLKIKDVVGGEFTITLTLNGSLLHITTVYRDQNNQLTVNRGDDFRR
jgi:hypothetical protein